MTEPPRIVKAVRAVQDLLTALGVDPEDENFRETPRRFASYMLEHFPTQRQRREELATLTTTFPSKYKGIISMKHSKVYGMCPHHLLPVEYDISIAYIPDGQVLGLSKLARFAEHYARQACLQEDVTESIAQAIGKHIKTLGIMVVVEGVHSCMEIRGVKMDESSTVTSTVAGVFLDESKEARNEFLALIGRK